MRQNVAEVVYYISSNLSQLVNMNSSQATELTSLYSFLMIHTDTAILSCHALNLPA